MKAVILAGGLGTRISEESHLRPKPMVEIGGMPILWHVMKIYAHHGIEDFVICLGYKGYMIKEYFSNYFLHASDVTIDARTNRRHLPQHPRRTLADHAGRHRRADADRRPAEARRRNISTRASRSASPTATASPTSTFPPKSPSTAATAARRR